jgi:hypothetical protein
MKLQTILRLQMDVWQNENLRRKKTINYLHREQILIIYSSVLTLIFWTRDT